MQDRGGLHPPIDLGLADALLQMRIDSSGPAVPGAVRRSPSPRFRDAVGHVAPLPLWPGQKPRPIGADVVVTIDGNAVTVEMHDAFTFDLTVTRTALQADGSLGYICALAGLR
jgi:hypothetical protein